jgi:DNA-binding transcriptional LysR family regulator
VRKSEQCRKPARACSSDSARRCSRSKPRGPIAWEFERNGEVLKVEPPAPLLVNLGSAADLLVAAAIEGSGIIYLFEDWLQPHFDSGALKPIIERWWLRFPGPFLYYPSRRHMPAALRAFVDFIRG